MRQGASYRVPFTLFSASLFSDAYWSCGAPQVSRGERAGGGGGRGGGSILVPQCHPGSRLINGHPSVARALGLAPPQRRWGTFLGSSCCWTGRHPPGGAGALSHCQGQRLRRSSERGRGALGPGCAAWAPPQLLPPPGLQALLSRYDPGIPQVSRC